MLDVEVVEDRTKGSLADEGFLKVRRLVVRTKFKDGTASAPYPCDILSRVRTDAVALLLYERTGTAAPRGGRKARRPPVRGPVAGARGRGRPHAAEG